MTLTAPPEGHSAQIVQILSAFRHKPAAQADRGDDGSLDTYIRTGQLEHKIMIAEYDLYD